MKIFLHFRDKCTKYNKIREAEERVDILRLDILLCYHILVM